MNEAVRSLFASSLQFFLFHWIRVQKTRHSLVFSSFTLILNFPLAFLESDDYTTHSLLSRVLLPRKEDMNTKQGERETRLFMYRTGRTEVDNSISVNHPFDLISFHALLLSNPESPIKLKASYKNSRRFCLHDSSTGSPLYFSTTCFT